MSADATIAGSAGSLSATPSLSHGDGSLVSPAAGEQFQASAAQEVYGEPISKELLLGHEWVIWEHYDPAPGAPYKKQYQAASWSLM